MEFFRVGGRDGKGPAKGTPIIFRFAKKVNFPAVWAAGRF
jgi:hypothetical protein